VPLGGKNLLQKAANSAHQKNIICTAKNSICPAKIAIRTFSHTFPYFLTVQI